MLALVVFSVKEHSLTKCANKPPSRLHQANLDKSKWATHTDLNDSWRTSGEQRSDREVFTPSDSPAASAGELFAARSHTGSPYSYAFAVSGAEPDADRHRDGLTLSHTDGITLSHPDSRAYFNPYVDSDTYPSPGAYARTDCGAYRGARPRYSPDAGLAFTDDRPACRPPGRATRRYRFQDEHGSRAVRDGSDRQGFYQ